MFVLPMWWINIKEQHIVKILKLENSRICFQVSLIDDYHLPRIAIKYNYLVSKLIRSIIKFDNTICQILDKIKGFSFNWKLPTCICSSRTNKSWTFLRLSNNWPLSERPHMITPILQKSKSYLSRNFLSCQELSVK